MISKKIILIAVAVCSILVISIGVYVYSEKQAKEQARADFYENTFKKTIDPDLSF